MSSARPPFPEDPATAAGETVPPEPPEAPGAEAPGPVEGAAGEGGAPRALEERVRELEDRLRRAQADFVNETRRIQRQADERGRYAVEVLVRDLLPVFDALHGAREGFAQGRAAAGGDADEAGAAAAALEGFDLVEKELLNVLGRHGVQRIDAQEGVPFDHARHHAIVMMHRPDLEPGEVARELRPGFLLGERVVRPAHVAVVAAPEPPAAPDGQPDPGRA